MSDSSQCTDGINQMKARSDVWKEDTPDRCEVCNQPFVTLRFVNGKNRCGYCYGDEMGYFAKPDPQNRLSQETGTDRSGGTTDD